jgi:hypothetical protein
VNPLAALLGRVAADGLTLEARGDGLAVSPAERLTPELRALLLQFKPDLLELLRAHGPRLLGLFRDAPTWPAPRGRSAPAEHVWRLVGKWVRLSDGREGQLSFASYNTRTGRVRCRVEFPSGWALVDPEDVRGTEERRTA